MEPGHEGQNRSPERAPQAPAVTPEQLPSIPEHGPERVPERQPDRHEQPQPPQQGATTDDTSVVPSVTPPAPVADDDDSDNTDTLLVALPNVASDDDRIEREWVDKAKRIIIDTAHDPYKREKAITALQRDYLRKRYGKESGPSN